MKMIHEEAREVRHFSGKGKYISFISINAPVMSQLLFVFSLLDESVHGGIISRQKLSITVNRLIPTLSYFREARGS